MAGSADQLILHGPLMIAASAFLVAASVNDLRARRSVAAATECAGSVAWLAGNVWWCSGAVIARVTPWWVLFLVLTISGERLEERREMPMTAFTRALFVIAVSRLLAGALPGSIRRDSGFHTTFVSGVGLLMLAAWLLRNDAARSELRGTGLGRFVSLALVTGFCWLAVAGAVSIGADVSSSGLAYDAFLHAVFTGFVLSMIVAHAPSELAKAVGGVPRYRSLFYLHLVILHASVVLRVSGDLVDSLARFRAWRGLLTAVALAAFAANTALARRSTDDA